MKKAIHDSESNSVHNLTCPLQNSLISSGVADSPACNLKWKIKQLYFEIVHVVQVGEELKAIFNRNYRKLGTKKAQWNNSDRGLQLKTVEAGGLMVSALASGSKLGWAQAWWATWLIPRPFPYLYLLEFQYASCIITENRTEIHPYFIHAQTSSPNRASGTLITWK